MRMRLVVEMIKQEFCQHLLYLKSQPERVILPFMLKSLLIIYSMCLHKRQFFNTSI